MDIVHIIETNLNKSNQEDTTSHTYAEIERTIAIDHSEGATANTGPRRPSLSICFPLRCFSIMMFNSLYESSFAAFVFSGFSALHEDIDSPRTCRRTEAPARHPMSGQQVPVVSAEELSSSLSSLGDPSGRLETDTSASLHLKHVQKLQKETEKTQ